MNEKAGFAHQVHRKFHPDHNVIITHKINPGAISHQQFVLQVVAGPPEVLPVIAIPPVDKNVHIQSVIIFPEPLRADIPELPLPAISAMISPLLSSLITMLPPIRPVRITRV